MEAGCLSPVGMARLPVASCAGTQGAQSFASSICSARLVWRLAVVASWYDPTFGCKGRRVEVLFRQLRRRRTPLCGGWPFRVSWYDPTSCCVSRGPGKDPSPPAGYKWYQWQGDLNSDRNVGLVHFRRMTTTRFGGWLCMLSVGRNRQLAVSP